MFSITFCTLTDDEDELPTWLVSGEMCYNFRETTSHNLFIELGDFADCSNGRVCSQILSELLERLDNAVR